MNEGLRTARRSTALLRALSTDFLLREQFVTDPAGLFTDYMGGAPLSAEATNAVNDLVYAVVSNPQTLEWLGTLAAGETDGGLSDDALARGLAVAASRSGDEAVVSSLIKFGSADTLSIAPALGVLRGIALGVRGVGGRAGTEFTPGTGTNVTPGTGTNFTPGNRTRSTPETGTEFTPGTGTEFTPGTGTEFTPGTEATPGTGTEFTPGAGPAVAGGTNVSPGTGTNFTPGTGTNVSPGTGTNVSPGTEVSPGGIVGRFGEFQVTLDALVDFARQVRRAGALTETGFG